MLFIAGISISIFLGLLLVSKRGKGAADTILACWFLVIGIHLLLYYLHFSGSSFQYPQLLGLTIPLPLIHGPFLYLYTATLTKQLPEKRLRILPHFLPVLFSYLFLTPFFLLPADQKIFIFQNRGVGFETFTSINFLAILTSGLAYVLWSHVLLQKHRAKILHEFSNTEKVNLRWLQYLMYGIAVIWLFVFAGKQELTFGAVVLFVVLTGYFGIRQTHIFTSIPSPAPSGGAESPIGEKRTEISAVLPPHNPNVLPIETKPAEPAIDLTDKSDAPAHREPHTDSMVVQSGVEVAVDKRKYSKSGLSAEGAERLHLELQNLMEAEKLYTDSELSLSALAARLNSHPNYLSQVINDKEGKNFYDYINTLRIEEFKRLVLDPGNQKFTILSLAFECGFNSKSSFNRYFKRITGQSPSEYVQFSREQATA